MSSQLSAATLALSLTASHEGYYIKKNFKVDRVPERELSPNEVITEVQKAVISAVYAAPDTSYRIYEKLRLALCAYDGKYQPDQLLVKRTEALISFLFLNAFSKNKMQNNGSQNGPYLTSGLEVVLKSEYEMNSRQCYELLIRCMSEYFSAPVPSGAPTLSMSVKDTWTKGIGAFVSQVDASTWELWRISVVDWFMSMIDAKELFEASLEAKRRGIQHNENATSIEQFMERVLRSKASHVSDDLEALKRRLTGLSIEQLLLQELLYVLSFIPILADIAGEYFETPCSVKDNLPEDKASHRTILLNRHIENDESLTALGMKLQVVKACKKIARHGVDPGLQPLLRTLVELRETELGETANELIKTLKYNSIYYEVRKRYEAMGHIATAAQSINQQNPDLFYSGIDGYHTLRLQNLLCSFGFTLYSVMDGTSKLPFAERFSESNKVAEMIKAALYTIPLSIWREKKVDLYSEIYLKLQQLALRSKKSSAALVNCHRVVISIHNTSEFNSELVRGDPIKLPTSDSFEKEEAVIAGVWKSKLKETVSYLLSRIKAELKIEKAKDAAQDAATNPVARNMPRAKTKAKSPDGRTVENSASTEERAAVDESLQEEAVVLQMQQLAVERPLERVATTLFKSVFNYHERVTRWFATSGSERDPFLSDPHYKLITNPHKVLWQRVKHGFALAVDRYVQNGIVNSNVADLKAKSLHSQLQLVGQITVELGSYRQERRGVFSYSTSARTKECFHRYFTTVDSERIQSEYTQNGHWKIDFPPLEVATRPAGKKGKNQQKETAADNKVLLDDGSYIASDDGVLVTIKDPRNHATIVLVKI